jgi:hypothetical protein
MLPTRAAALFTLALAAAQPAISSPPAPPAFRPDRAAEDYSYLRDPDRRGHWQDAYKFIPLGRDGNTFFSLGGELRERIEILDAPRFGLGGTEGDTYLLQRILTHADLRLGTSIRVFAQFGAHEAFGKAILNPPDQNSLDIHQLFVDVMPVQGLRLRVGRQEMMFNPAQRFVSFRDGTNVRQNFEGARVSWERGPARVEGFLTRPVTLRPGMFDNAGNREQSFAGIYTSHRIGPRRSASLDGYWFLLDRENLNERRHSLGLRFAGTTEAWDGDVEGVYQFGSSGSRDISAWAASADLGHSFATLPWKPRLGLRFDAGSGDGNPLDATDSTFHPLFPSGPYFNEANAASWTNLIGVRPSLRIQPDPRLTLLAAVQFKWRQNRDDAVYLGPSAALAGTRLNQETEIGQVYTLDAQYQISRNFGLRGYYLHHTAGAAIATAGGQPIDFLMGSITFRF